MNKYKLIKKYPNSPEVGCIVEYYDYGRYAKGDFIVDQLTLDSNPEFWKVVKEEYEILSLKYNDDPDTGLCFKDEEDDTFKYKNNLGNGHEGSPAKNCLDNGWSIHSIRRIHDDKVFTLGDKVLHKNNVSNRNGIIVRFHVLSNGVWFKTNNFDTPMCYILYVKPKKVLFKTEDGVDIFEGDTYYNVFEERFNSLEPFQINGPHEATDIPGVSYGPHSKFFSSKEAAEKYVDLHKPIYSKLDLSKALAKYLNK